MNPAPDTNASASTNPGTTPLRDWVMAQVQQRWESWALEHPHLARTIDRMKLVDSAVQRLQQDPEFQAALRQADLDESRLHAAGKVFQLIERLISRVLR